MVWQWDCDSGPGGAVDWTVDGGLVELEGRAAHVVDCRWETLGLDKLPRVGPDRDEGKKTKNNGRIILKKSGTFLDLKKSKTFLKSWWKSEKLRRSVLFGGVDDGIVILMMKSCEYNYDKEANLITLG